jgi:hypothetical protein
MQTSLRLSLKIKSFSMVLNDHDIQLLLNKSCVTLQLLHEAETL